MDAVLAREFETAKDELLTTQGNPSRGNACDHLLRMLAAFDATCMTLDPQTGNVSNVLTRQTALLGYPRTRWLDEPRLWSSVIHPEHREQVERLRRSAVLSEQPVIHEFRAKTREGNDVWLQEALLAEDASTGVGLLHAIQLDITEKLDTERNLREIFHTLQMSKNEVYVFTKDSLQYRYASPSALTNLGMSIGELKELTPRDLMRNMGEAAFFDLLGRVNGETGEEVRFNSHHARADGSEYPVSVALFLAAFAGEPAYKAIVLDTTHVHQLEQANERAELQFSTVAENMYDALVIDDAEGRITYCNDTFLEYLGLTRDEVDGLIMEEYIAPEFRSIVRDKHESRKTGEAGTEVYEFQCQRKDGQKFWVQARTVAMFQNGEFIGTQSVLLDISEKLRVERELQRYQRHVIDLINSSRGIVWESLAGAPVFTYVSQQAERLLRHPLSKWTSEPGFFLSCVHPEDRERVDEAYGFNGAELCATGQKIEFRLLTADGREIWLEDEIILIQQDDQQPVIRGLMVDISERKKLAAALRKLGEHRAHNMETETRVLLRESFEAYARRLSHVANGLNAWLEAAGGGSAPESDALKGLWAETQAISQEMANHSFQLMQQRIKAHGLEGSIRKFSDRLFATDGLLVNIQAENISPTLSEDVLLCAYRIVREALNNVVRHSQATEAEISLLGSEAELLIEVRDAGRGFNISMVDIEKSLGLMNIQERVSSLDGTVRFISQPGKGTTVSARLPLRNNI